MADAPSDIPVLRWSAHPALDHAGRALAGVVVVAALAAAVGVLAGSVAAAIGAVAFLLVALNRFYFPSRFEIDAEGVTARYPLARAQCQWRKIRYVAVGREAGWLSMRPNDRRRRGRGVHLLFGRHRDVVLEALRAYGPAGLDAGGLDAAERGTRANGGSEALA